MRPWRTKEPAGPRYPLRSPPHFHLRPGRATDSDAAAPPASGRSRAHRGADCRRERLFAAHPFHGRSAGPGGAIPGALDIYHGLAAAACGPEEIADLRQHIHAQRAWAVAPRDVRAGSRSGPSAGGKEKLITMLEALAGRVEARARTAERLLPRGRRLLRGRSDVALRNQQREGDRLARRLCVGPCVICSYLGVNTVLKPTRGIFRCCWWRFCTSPGAAHTSLPRISGKAPRAFGILYLEPPAGGL